jgi:hypothetical protein
LPRITITTTITTIITLRKRRARGPGLKALFALAATSGD